jgi:nitroreductase
MELDEAILTRRTVHKYRPGPVPSDVIERAFRAAHAAPNHKLTFPWRFTVVGPKARAALGALAAEVKAQKHGGPVTEEGKLAASQTFLTPGLLIAIGCVRSQDPARAREDYAAVACATQNLMLSFWASGFGSKWGTGAVTRHPKAYEILAIDAEKEEIVGFLYAGVPETVPTPPSRPAARDFVREVG